MFKTGEFKYYSKYFWNNFKTRRKMFIFIKLETIISVYDTYNNYNIQ